MRTRIRRPSAGLVVACIALFAAVCGTSVAATGLLSGSQIKKGSIPLNRLTKGAQKSLGRSGPAGERGARGAKGATGAQGPAGSPGTQGSQGPQGPAGSPGATGSIGLTGSQGPPGPAGGDVNRITQVATLAATSTPTTWFSANGSNCGSGGSAEGTASIDEKGLEITVPNESAFGGAQYDVPGGTTLEDLDTLSYTERYDGGVSDSAPYVEIDLSNGGALNFGPYEQIDSDTQEGVWQTWEVFAPSSRFNVNHESGQYMSAAEATTTDGKDTVADVEVQAGCASGSGGSTSTVSSLQMDAGSQMYYFLFGGS